MKQDYLELTHLIERMHRRFLDVLRAELARAGIKDMNAVQALLLANIGDEDIVIRDLIERGYYQGSNVSYNIKKLTENGYLEQRRAEHDKRSVRIKLTDKAKEVVERVRSLEDRNAETLQKNGLDSASLKQTTDMLRSIERTWADIIHFGG